MLRVANVLLVLCGASLLSARASAQITAMPKPDDGYLIAKTDVPEDAPPGYEGRSDVMSQTAVGNTDATRGKKYVMRITIANKVKTCPSAGGDADGDGELSAGFDYTDSNTGESEHYDMHAKAKYHAKVGDDAMIDGPMKEDVDYTFTKSGTSARGAGPAPKPVDDHQKVSFSYLIVPGGEIPKFGDFSGGDATAGGYSQAYGTTVAVGFFAAYFYSVAETKWLHGLCVHVVFDPPSNSRQPVPGSKVRVLGFIKTWGGDNARGLFPTIESLPNGGVVESGGSSTDGNSPAYFFLTAPTAPTAPTVHIGFDVKATSRAGAAEAAWEAKLGTGWSGEISASQVSSGDDADTQFQSWTNYEATQVTIDVRDGVGFADGYSETRHTSENRHGVYHPGGATIEFDNGGSSNAQAMGRTNATVDVVFDTTNGTYIVMSSYAPFLPPGRMHSTTCIRANCSSHDQPYGVQGILKIMTGKTDDRNHVMGSQTVTTPNIGTSGHGQMVYTLRWDLSRLGTTK